ncbi:MAG: TonB-dependent receptor domain-containing protein, partial [Longimicrobiales bacterium]
HMERGQSVSASGTGLAPGTSSLNGTSSDFQVDETNAENITIGAYAQQQLAWRDRVFANVAVRGDRNSAFGTNLGWIWYPAVSASWVVSDESFFPELPALASLRLRGAWGQSGLRPGFRDAVQFFESVTAAGADNDEPGFVISGAGNPDLKPERSSEVELGFDAGFARDRVGVELTWYNKISRDALIDRVLAPSLGATATRFENIGEVRNRGWEAALALTPVRTSRIEWQLNVAASTNDNELLVMNVEPIKFGLDGTAQQMHQGYALGGYWNPRILSFSDANGDGVITQAEVQVDTSDSFLGSAQPTRELALSSTLNLTSRVRLHALLDHKGGHKLLNINRFNRCTATSAVCDERHLPDASLRAQAEVSAYLKEQTLVGFIEDASFWKLREVSMTLTAPAEWARRFGGRSASLTLAGRNLFTWSKYSGLDPEVNWNGQANFGNGDGATLPAFRMFVARIDLSF